MSSQNRDITARITRQGSLLVNLVWLATLAAAVPQVWPILDGAVWMKAAGLAAAALPAFAGLTLARRQDKPFERFVIALLWTALAAGVTLTGGGVSGLGVLAFLLGPAVAAARGDRDSIAKAVILSSFAAGLIGLLQLTGFVKPAPMSVELHLPFVFGVATMIAAGFGFGAIRAVREADRARADATGSQSA